MLIKVLPVMFTFCFALPFLDAVFLLGGNFGLGFGAFFEGNCISVDVVVVVVVGGVIES